MARENKDREKKTWSTPTIKELKAIETEGATDNGPDATLRLS
jgi:hypothetical protein